MKNWILFSKIVLKSYILVDHVCATVKGGGESCLFTLRSSEVGQWEGGWGLWGGGFLVVVCFSSLSPFLIFAAWPAVAVTPLVCRLTHHEARRCRLLRVAMVTAVRGWKNALRLPGTEEVEDALTRLEEDTGWEEEEERERNVRQSRSVLHKTINTICPVTQVYCTSGSLDHVWSHKLSDCQWIPLKKHQWINITQNNDLCLMCAAYSPLPCAIDLLCDPNTIKDTKSNHRVALDAFIRIHMGAVVHFESVSHTHIRAEQRCVLICIRK